MTQRADIEKAIYVSNVMARSSPEEIEVLKGRYSIPDNFVIDNDGILVHIVNKMKDVNEAVELKNEKDQEEVKALQESPRLTIWLDQLQKRFRGPSNNVVNVDVPYVPPYAGGKGTLTTQQIEDYSKDFWCGIRDKQYAKYLGELYNVILNEKIPKTVKTEEKESIVWKKEGSCDGLAPKFAQRNAEGEWIVQLSAANTSTVHYIEDLRLLHIRLETERTVAKDKQQQSQQLTPTEQNSLYDVIVIVMRLNTQNDKCQTSWQKFMIDNFLSYITVAPMYLYMVNTAENWKIDPAKAVKVYKRDVNEQKPLNYWGNISFDNFIITLFHKKSFIPIAKKRNKKR